MMRQIDAEALKKSVREKFKALPDRCEINGLVNAAPTVDAIPVDWIKLNIAISALVEDDDAAGLLLALVDAWQKSGWSLFDGVLPAKEAEKYAGMRPWRSWERSAAANDTEPGLAQRESEAL